MTIYVDSTQQYSSGPWCHMASDDLDELHRFAAKLRLRRAWFQDHAVMPHYDLRPSKRLLAIERGAIEVSRYELLALCTDRYPQLRERTLERLAEQAEKKQAAAIDYLESLKNRDLPDGMIVDEYSPNNLP